MSAGGGCSGGVTRPEMTSFTSLSVSDMCAVLGVMRGDAPPMCGKESCLRGPTLGDPAPPCVLTNKPSQNESSADDNAQNAEERTVRSTIRGSHEIQALACAQPHRRLL